MEHTETEMQSPLEHEPKLIFTEEIRSYMYDAARWARFLSIVGFVISALMVMAAFSMGAIISSGLLNNSVYGPLAQIGGSALTIVFLFYTLLIFVPSFLLYKYAANSIQGILYMDQSAITESFKKMKSFFRFYGILFLIVMGLYIISFLSAIMTAM